MPSFIIFFILQILVQVSLDRGTSVVIFFLNLVVPVKLWCSLDNYLMMQAHMNWCIYLRAWSICWGYSMDKYAGISHSLYITWFSGLFNGCNGHVLFDSLLCGTQEIFWDWSHVILFDHMWSAWGNLCEELLSGTPAQLEVGHLKLQKLCWLL
jgi:hypothetical protein